MISYIITSTLLSLTGWGIYLLLVRRKASLTQQKVFIYLTISGSLLLPLTVSQHTETLLAPNPYVKPISIGNTVEHQHLQQFCQCEKPDYSHRILYQTNAYYNFLFQHKQWLSSIIFTAIGLMIFWFVIQIFYLNHLVNTSDKSLKTLEGESFFLLFPPKKLGVGAFRLRGNYIIWQQEMESLKTEEVNAILVHELSHLQQGNTLEKALLRVIQCLWFANPAFYYFQKELELLSECIADRKGSEAMGTKKDYARLLLRLKTLQPVALVQHFKGNVLQTRIELLLTDKTSYPTGLAGFFLLGIFQLTMVSPLSAGVSQTIHDLETYEEIYHKVEAGRSEAVYCRDCETVCFPEELIRTSHPESQQILPASSESGVLE